MSKWFDALASDLEHRMSGAEAAMSGILSLPGNQPAASHEPCKVCAGTGGYSVPNDGNGCPACAGTGWSDVAAWSSSEEKSGD